jgi:hypothetical protein
VLFYKGKTIDVLKNKFNMKSFLIFTFSLVSFLSFSQKNEYALFLMQHGEKVKIRRNQATIEKAPFQLVYKFRTPISWGLIAGSNTKMQNAFSSGPEAVEQILQKAESGGADGYFNESKSIRAWNGKIQTDILYEDDQHHRFDSLYRMGSWIFGVRTVSFLSTENDESMVEEWPDSTLIIGTVNTKYLSNTDFKPKTILLKLHLKDIPNTSVFDVKGKTFVEEGEASYQEGCEGCGNLGSFEFKKNGKEVEYLRSGSDTFSYDSYKQENYQITIGEDYMSFTISSDGTQLIENKTGTKYNLVTR